MNNIPAHSGANLDKNTALGFFEKRFEPLVSVTLPEIEHFEIFSRPLENKLAQQFFVKFNLLLSYLIC